MNTTPITNPSSKRRPNPTAACAMRDAWAMARKAQTLYGGSAQQYLPEALRIAWSDLNGNSVVQTYREIVKDIRAMKATKRLRPRGQSRYRKSYYDASW